jgi:hypothetical protein
MNNLEKHKVEHLQLTELGDNYLDHGNLDGLGDNDHDQYLLVTDIDDIPVDSELSAPISSNWAYDHLVANDPHSPYLLLAGRAGGQTAYGGTAASNNLILNSTSNATKGLLLLQSEDGKVGINTTAVPHGGIGWAKFAIDGANGTADGPHVQFTTATDDYPIFQLLNYTHDNINILFDAYYDGGWKSSDVGSNYLLRKTGDKFYLQYSSGNAQGATVTWTANGLVFDTSGMLGIGVLPAYRLHVDGATAASNNIAAFFDSNASDNTNHYITIGKALSANQAVHIGHHYDSDGATSSYSFIEYAGDAAPEGINLKSGGLVGIGVLPAYELDVYAPSGTACRIFSDGNLNSSIPLLLQGGEDTPTTNGDIRWIQLNDGDAGALTYIIYTTTSPYAAFSAISDARVKENIKDTSINGLDIINNIKLREFDFIDRKKPHQKIGLIAQELLNVYPECVAYDKEVDLYNVAESPLLLPLIKAVQEISAKNAELTNHINELTLQLKKQMNQMEKLQNQVKILMLSINGESK